MCDDTVIVYAAVIVPHDVMDVHLVARQRRAVITEGEPISIGYCREAA